MTNKTIEEIKSTFYPNKYNSIYIKIPNPSFKKITNSVYMLKSLQGINLNDYYICEKTDGERYLLYINKDGILKLINSSLEVKNLGLKLNKFCGSLLDGEYVSETKTFYIFDIIFFDGKDISFLNFTKRFTLLNKFKIKHPKINIKAKNFTDPKEFKSFGKAAQKVYSHKYNYEIDGLILTPKFLNYRGKVLKWKPPEETTTDFLVKVYKETPSEFFIRLYSSISKRDVAKYKFNEKINSEIKSENIKNILGITKDLDRESLIPIPFYIPNKDFEDKYSYAKIKKGWNSIKKLKDIDGKIVEMALWAGLIEHS